MREVQDLPEDLGGRVVIVGSVLALGGVLVLAVGLVKPGTFLSLRVLGWALVASKLGSIALGIAYGLWLRRTILAMRALELGWGPPPWLAAFAFVFPIGSLIAGFGAAARAYDRLRVEGRPSAAGTFRLWWGLGLAGHALLIPAVLLQPAPSGWRLAWGLRLAWAFATIAVGMVCVARLEEAYSDRRRLRGQTGVK